MNKQKFEDIIAEQGKLIYTCEGDSMYPFIRPRDLVVIEAVTRPLGVNDVPLYKRDNGQYVLHRIVDIGDSGYVMRGDNRAERETGIQDRHIIGVLTSVIRDGKTLPVESPSEYEARYADDLIYLLSCLINEKAPDPGRVEQIDIAGIYHISRLHSLTCAAAFALEEVMPLPHAFDQAKKKAIRKLSLFEIECAAVFSELEKAGIWYLPLKGIVLKNCYPKTAMREMSDCDILVDPSRVGDVKRIMESLGYKCEMFGRYIHDTYSKPPTIEFEMHHSLFDKKGMPLFASYYENIKDRLICDGFECKMTDEDFYLFFLCHAYKHYIDAGTGLRSLLDVYLNLRSHPDLDRDYIDAELQKLKLTDFERTIRELSQRVFSLGELDDAQRKELGYYISCGCYGNAETAEYHRMLKNLGNSDSKEAKREYLKKRIFISGDSLRSNYPFVAKHKALYPLLLVYRPIKGAVRRPGAILNEYKKVKRFRKKDD